MTRRCLGSPVAVTRLLFLWTIPLIASCSARAATLPAPSPSIFRDGDLVFQESRSSQSAAIQLATKSRYSHVGIVYVRDAKPFVFEAVEPVKLTPLESWIARGARGHVVVKRLRDAEAVLTPDVMRKMHELGEQLAGRHYDLAFSWEDERLYCSELVYKIYERAAAVKIGRLQSLGELDLSAPAVQRKLKERYGAKLPLERPVITPEAMLEDSKLLTVFSN